MKLTTDVIYDAIHQAKGILREVDDFNFENKDYIVEIVNAKSFWAEIKKFFLDIYRIKVSKIFEKIEDEEQAKERLVGCMIHEIIHSQKGCMNHGANFKRWAEKVNRKYPQYKVQRCNSSAEYNIDKSTVGRQHTTRWVLNCNHCNKEFTYMRKPKYLYSFTHGGGQCPTCGGRGFHLTMTPEGIIK